MDSLTQLVLGAAVGEAVAGKKLGNKAMLWGALAGTIPDMDVVTSLWMTDIESMAFHRGITHSILFSVLCPFALTAFARWYYRKKPHEQRANTMLWQVFWLLLGGMLLFGTGYLTATTFNAPTVVVFLFFGALGCYWIWRSFQHPYDDFVPISSRRWYLLFFLGLSTHITIDAFTTYGTQIFQPFSNLRVTTSTISVADPFYTVPFLICLTIASLFKRRDQRRSRWNTAGLIISTLYMVFTFVNKRHVHAAFQHRLTDMGVQTEHYMTNPTILNNFLWHGIAETDSNYIESYYSIFDAIPPFEEVRLIPKNRELLNDTDCSDSKTIDVLTWFSDDYYNYSKDRSVIYYNDLRFGSLWMDDAAKSSKSVFYFRLDPGCQAKEIRETEQINEAFDILIQRIKGK